MMKKFLVLTLCLISFVSFAIAKPKIVIGNDPDFPPFEFFNDKNELIGFDIDIGKALAEKMGYDYEFVGVAWSGIIPALESKKMDAIIGGMSITEERKKKVNFADSYFASGLSIVVKNNNNSIKDMKSLEGKTIAVKIGTMAKDVAEGVKGAKVLTFDTYNIMFDAVMTGKADALINDTPVNDYYMTVQGKDKFKTAFIHNSDDLYGIAVRKEDTKLLADINKALTEIKKDGTYNKISMKWFGKKLIK